MKINCLLILLCFASGCSSLPSLAKELKNDNATVVLTINTIYGTSKFIRSNPSTNQTVTISPDGTITIEATE